MTAEPTPPKPPPGNPAPAEWAAAGLEQPDMDVVRDYRLGRIRQELAAGDFAGAVLYDPVNLRYALDSSNMQVWCMHNAVRYAFVATDGPAIVFDFTRCEHLSDHLPLVTEARPATSWDYFENGPREGELAERWAAEIADLVAEHGRGSRRLAVDKCEPPGVAALQDLGVTPVTSMGFAERARHLKHPEEIKAMRCSLHTAEVGMWAMWDALRPGLTENQVWSILHQANIERGGEWIETRLLASGPRTNPWYSECSDRVIEKGDIVAFDTDLIGPFSYCADISRTWVAPGRRPTPEQRAMHAAGVEMLEHNLAILRPGMGFRDFAEEAYRLPDRYLAHRYSTLAHGVGLVDEYPAIRYPEDWEWYGYDGEIEPGQALCLEAFIGEEGGREGVKLEIQVLVTADGVERLDTFPMDLVPG